MRNSRLFAGLHGNHGYDDYGCLSDVATVDGTGYEWEYYEINLCKHF
ncbi:MAG TPA: hypothetical protein VFO41_02930 [Alphaproteobacteria bacterium]|nr:hypothetical protein [Alphaproteobacteria bacterium]